MQQNEWWRAENLQSEERRIRRASDTSTVDPRTDYGSYRMLLSGSDAAQSQIGSHNELAPEHRLTAIAPLLRMKDPAAILDAGCGAGFTTQVLALHYPGAYVLGVDISEDAVTYARSNHPQASFRVMSLVPLGERAGYFDLVFCFEFYPFTRNDDAQVHAEYISYFMDQITTYGQLVIYQVWNNPESLSAVYDELVHNMPQFRFNLYRIPHPKLLARLPVPLARIVAEVASLLSGKELMRRVLVIDRNGLADLAGP